MAKRIGNAGMSIEFADIFELSLNCGHSIQCTVFAD